MLLHGSHPMENSCCVQYAYIKYEFSIFSRCKDIEGVSKSPYLLIKFALRMRGVT